MALRGRALVGQSGGPTAVINASLAGIIEEARRHDEIEGVLGTRFGLLGILNEDLLDLALEDPERLRRIGRTPASALGASRRKLTPADRQRVLQVFAAHNIRFFFYIGGNDSADTAHQVQAAADEQGYALRCVAVPKTIDNDLAEMDHTPGYGSIARYIASATRDCACDAACIAPTDRVTLLEVMGRNAGWVAAASALARGKPADAPHLIYVPERPVTAALVEQQVQAAVRRYGYAMIVLTETIRDESGQAWARSTGSDGFGHARLVGAAERMGALIEERLGLKTRFNKPGTLQRAAGTCISEVDWQEAYAAGREAVARCMDGARAVMVTLLRAPGPPYACRFGLAPLVQIAHAERRLPPEFIAGDGDISPAFVDYALPLIGAPLPDYAALQGFPVMRQTAETQA